MGASKEKIEGSDSVRVEDENLSTNSTVNASDNSSRQDTVNVMVGQANNDSNNDVDPIPAEDSGATTGATAGAFIDANVSVRVGVAYTPEDPEVVEGKTYDISRENRGTKRVLYAISFLSTAAIIITILFVSGVFSKAGTVESKEAVYSLAVELSGEDALTDPESPQSKALNWMQNDQVIVPVNQKFRWTQRYSSAVVLFSFNETTYLNTTRHECDWNQLGLIDDALVRDPIYTIGLHCRNNLTISHLNFFYYKLSGTIATEIGHLANITDILIGGNPKLSGTIPSEIGKLTNLAVASIADTGLSGEIPTEISNARNLEMLLMYSTTKLSGNLEPICALPSLRWLSTDCGNGTSKDVYPCVTQCCDPKLLLCCTVGKPDECVTTDPNVDVF